jgi:hypothetical protein
MWFSHEEGKYFLEARVNFDAKETAGIFLGRTFSKSKKFWITPKIGILFGLNDLGYDGVSPEFNLGGKLKSFSYFAMNQFSIAITKDKPNFLYNYTQFGYKLFPWLQIDYSAQFYYELNSGAVWIDQGPQLLILWNKFYIKPWYTWDPGHTKVRKFICGVGCNF